VTEYSQRKVKQSITGNGNADKEQVWKMLQSILTLPAVEGHVFDASDALAVAVCHHFNSNPALASTGGKANNWAFGGSSGAPSMAPLAGLEDVCFAALCFGLSSSGSHPQSLATSPKQNNKVRPRTVSAQLDDDPELTCLTAIWFEPHFGHAWETSCPRGCQVQPHPSAWQALRGRIGMTPYGNKDDREHVDVSDDGSAPSMRVELHLVSPDVDVVLDLAPRRTKCLGDRRVDVIAKRFARDHDLAPRHGDRDRDVERRWLVPMGDGHGTSDNTVMHALEPRHPATNRSVDRRAWTHADKRAAQR